jgi:hypothetical protein
MSKSFCIFFIHFLALTSWRTPDTIYCKMKLRTQLEVYKAIRKPLPPKTRIERPLKGRGHYRRPRNGKDISHE